MGFNFYGSKNNNRTGNFIVHLGGQMKQQVSNTFKHQKTYNYSIIIRKQLYLIHNEVTRHHHSCHAVFLRKGGSKFESQAPHPQVINGPPSHFLQKRKKKRETCSKQLKKRPISVLSIFLKPAYNIQIEDSIRKP